MDKTSILSVLVSVLLILILLLIIDLKETISKVFSFGLLPFFVANILFVFTYAIQGMKWKVIVQHFKKISVLDSILITVIGYFVNNIFPARIGEIARAFVLSKKTGLGKAVSLSTVMVARLTDVIALLFLFFVGLAFTQKIPQEITTTALVLLALFLIIFFALLLSKKIWVYFKPMLLWVPIIVKNVSKDLASGIEAMKTAGAKIWLLSLFSWLAYVPLYHYVLSVLGISLGITEILVISSIISLSALIPSAPGYIGTLEAASVIALGIFGVDASTAVSFAVINHLIIYFSTTILGIISLNMLSIKFSELKVSN